MNNRELGIQIKKARKEAGLTQSDLAKKLSITWEMVSRYENGRSSARENLEKIAKFTKKPVTFFYGSPDISNSNIDKLVEELKKRGVGYIPGQDQTGRVPFIEEISDLALEENIKLTRQTYFCPDWVLQKFQNVFALRLNAISSDFLEINPKDIGYFSQSSDPLINYLVLTKDEGKYKLVRFSEEFKLPVLAVLLSVEKRYVY